MASRGQTIPTIVAPALARGAIVVSDRCLWASVAFQGGGEGWGIEKVLKLNRDLIGDVIPGLSLFLDVRYDTAKQRDPDVLGDKWEKMGLEFFERVRKAYLWMVEERPELNLVRIDGEGSREEVHERVLEVVAPKLTMWGVGMLGLV
jgi:dTMP kinase